MEKVKLISPQFLNLSYLQSPHLFALPLRQFQLLKLKRFSSTVKKLSRKISSLKRVCLGNSTEVAQAEGSCTVPRGLGDQHLRGRRGTRWIAVLCEAQSRRPRADCHSSRPGPALRPTEPGPWRRAPITSGNRGGVPGGHTFVQGGIVSPLTGACACTVRTQAVILHFSLVFDKDSITTSARPGGGGRRRSGRCGPGSSPHRREAARAQSSLTAPGMRLQTVLPGLLQYIKAFFVNRCSRELQGTPQG